MSENKEYGQFVKEYFNDLMKNVFSDLKEGEKLNTSLGGEHTDFIRVNQSKVRQTTNVRQVNLTHNFVKDGRNYAFSHCLSLNADNDIQFLKNKIEELRKSLPALPENPFAPDIKNNGTSDVDFHRNSEPGKIDELLSPFSSVDMAGIWVDGAVLKGNLNSEGQSHWFSTETSLMDYSLFTEKQKAVKGMFSARDWDEKAYRDNVTDSISKIEKLELPEVVVERGKHRTYFGPAVYHELMGLMGYGWMSEASYQYGKSPMKKMKEGETLSPLFNLSDNFQLGLTPKFNQLGEVSEDKVDIIKDGKLVQLLCSSKTSKEFKVPTNNASLGEGMRAPDIATGTLKRDDILKTLNTGLYISNIHYTNWSERQTGRITGMTRYACFWVEKGEIVGPIKDLRFDETFYHFWGKGLEALTDFSEIIPENGTYFHREIGGGRAPGMIVNDFSYTL